MKRIIVTEPAPVAQFRYTFTQSNLGNWKLQEEQMRKTLSSRTDAFLGHMDPVYPERGEFLVEVTAAAERKPDKGFPVMEVSVGYRPTPRSSSAPRARSS